ncbi:hypothetical protein QAD02_002992 [Eretmocerus hayati]|uniref:Uncharacterized protein n=1 Tax=Eretmocerus hayati TaxID=131215 RepID=A0ACC2NLP1_9HYME|nr:hypothetical protein QAD02_002992 [Eretmocerus hayati]
MSLKGIGSNTDPCLIFSVQGIAQTLLGEVCLTSSPSTRFTLILPNEPATEICADCTTRRIQDSDFGKTLTENIDEHIVGYIGQPIPYCQKCNGLFYVARPIYECYECIIQELESPVPPGLLRVDNYGRSGASRPIMYLFHFEN